MTKITDRYALAKETSPQNILGRRELSAIIKETKEEYGLGDETIVKTNTILKRYKRRTKDKMVRMKPPLEIIEPHIVQMVVQRSLIRRPWDKQELIFFVNSFISGSSLQKDLIDYQRSIKVLPSNHGYVGLGWYNKFLRRHPIIASKTVVKFGTKRSEWVTADNFELMYDGCYSAFIDAKIATKGVQSIYLDEYGREVRQDAISRLGRSTKFILTKPKYLFFVDECGSNTNAEKDGTQQERRLCRASDRPHQLSSSSDHHYTTLAFTDATGIAVLCVVIIAGESLNMVDIMGCDLMATDSESVFKYNTEDEDLMRLLADDVKGENGVFSGGPTCVVDGKSIPPYVTCSTSGGITPEILTNSLKHLDEYMSFDRSTATPTLLLDGHGSRFDETFLEYANPDNEEKGWKVVLGCPYGTSLWQVGDSRSQNGMYKKHTYRRKAQLMSHKSVLHNFNSGISLTKQDIIPIVKYAWDRSFALSESNRRAIAVRGWNPLNYALLDNIEIQRLCDKPNVSKLAGTDLHDEISTEELTKMGLNLRSGYAGRCVLQLLQLAKRDSVMIQRLEEEKKNRVNVLNVLDGVKQLTAGKLYRSGEVVLGSDCLKHVREMKRDKASQLESTMDYHSLAFDKAKSKVIHILTKYNKNHSCELTNWRSMNMSKVCATDQKILIGYLKEKGDDKMPVEKADVLARLNDDIKYKQEPTLLLYLQKKGKTVIEAKDYLRVREAQHKTVEQVVEDVHDTTNEAEIV